jgi:hypothetical protein
MVTQPFRSGFHVLPAECLDDAGMVLSRQTDPTGITQVGSDVSPRRLPHGVDHIQEPLIRAVPEQGLVPLFFQCHYPIRIASGGRQLAVDLTEPGKPIAGQLGERSKREHFEGAQNGSSIPHFSRVQAADGEASTHIRVDDAFSGQSQERFTYRRAADPKLAG